MGDSASESDSSSLDGGAMLPPSTVSRDQLQKRIESLQQQNRYFTWFNSNKYSYIDLTNFVTFLYLVKNSYQIGVAFQI